LPPEPNIRTLKRGGGERRLTRVGRGSCICDHLVDQLLRHGAYGNVQAAIALVVSDDLVALVATSNAVTMLQRNSTTSGPDTVSLGRRRFAASRTLLAC
jgi:hypothetical protein